MKTLYSVVYSVDGGEKCTKYVKAKTDEDAADMVEKILKRDGCDISKLEVLDVVDCSIMPPDEIARLLDMFNFGKEPK